VYPDTAEFPERLQDPDLKKAFGPEIYAEVQDSLKNWWTLGYFQRTDREMRCSTSPRCRTSRWS
jgi:hypothetical protein